MALLIAPALWASASPDEPKDERKGDPSINGSVSDAESKKPVQGVTVSISGKGQDKKETLTTDASGNFILKYPALQPGANSMVVL